MRTPIHTTTLQPVYTPLPALMALNPRRQQEKISKFRELLERGRSSFLPEEKTSITLIPASPSPSG
jgi:hypothetical protein